MPNEITKVRLVIREFIWKIRDVRKSKDASWEWLNRFADTLQYQDLENSPDAYALELLAEARGFADTKKLNQQLRWIRDSLAKEGVSAPTKTQIDERWRKIYGDNAPEKKPAPKSHRLKAPTKPEPEKRTYGEFANVALSDEESAKLQAKLGPARFERGVEVLGAWKVNNPAKAARIKSDYACFTSWVIKRLDEEKEADAKSPKAFAASERDRMAEIVRNEFPDVIEEFGL